MCSKLVQCTVRNKDVYQLYMHMCSTKILGVQYSIHISRWIYFLKLSFVFYQTRKKFRLVYFFRLRRLKNHLTVLCVTVDSNKEMGGYAMYNNCSTACLQQIQCTLCLEDIFKMGHETEREKGKGRVLWGGGERGVCRQQPSPAISRGELIFPKSSNWCVMAFLHETHNCFAVLQEGGGDVANETLC